MIRDCLIDRMILRQIRSAVYTGYEDWTAEILGHPTVDELERFNGRSTMTFLREAYHRRVGTLSWSEAEYFGTIGGYGTDTTTRRAHKARHYVMSESDKEETERMVQIGDLIPTDTVQRSPCWRKERHTTREAARIHLERLKDSGNSQDEASLDTYLCRHCNHWHVGHDRLKELPMTDLAQTLTNGGTVTVFLGSGYDLPREYAGHPQIDGVAANELIPSRAGSVLKANTRAVIMTDRIHYQIQNVLTQELHRRRMACFIRRGDRDLQQALDQIFHRKHEEQKTMQEPTQQPITTPQPTETDTEVEVARRIAPRGTSGTIAPRGAIPSLVEELWPQIEGMKPTDGGRYIYKIAQERHITTTPLSCEQAVRVRRQHGPTKWASRGAGTVQTFEEAVGEMLGDRGEEDRPVTTPPETGQQKALRLLDNMIVGLQSVREFVSTIETNTTEVDALRKRNSELEDKMRAIKSAFGL